MNKCLTFCDCKIENFQAEDHAFSTIPTPPVTVLTSQEPPGYKDDSDDDDSISSDNDDLSE